MGYYSTFEVVDTTMPLEELCDKLNSFSKKYDWADPGWEIYDDCIRGYDGTKWYYWLDDLTQYALHYPEDYFIILRHGEESPDMSRAIVRNGKAVEQFPSISWPTE